MSDDALPRWRFTFTGHSAVPNAPIAISTRMSRNISMKPASPPPIGGKCGIWPTTHHGRGRNLVSIFLGGGTPSLMSPALVADILETAERLFGFAPDIEITAEANPTSAEAAVFRGFQTAGVNRVSLGVQSLDDAALAFLGREHSAKEALRRLPQHGAVLSVCPSI